MSKTIVGAVVAGVVGVAAIGLYWWSNAKEEPAEKLSNFDYVLTAIKHGDTVVLATAQASDELLAEIESSPRIRSLNLAGSAEVTDEGLGHVANMNRLTSLWLGRTKVTDASMKKIAKLNRLRVLSLTDTKVTGAGLAQLAPLEELEQLSLSGSDVEDEDMALIKSFPTAAATRRGAHLCGGQWAGRNRCLPQSADPAAAGHPRDRRRARTTHQFAETSCAGIEQLQDHRRRRPYSGKTECGGAALYQRH